MIKRAACAAALAIGLFAGPALAADDLRSIVETNTKQWLDAFNHKPETLGELYTNDAILIPAGERPIIGARAIQQFWAALIKSGVKNYGLDTVLAEARDDLAYDVAAWHAAQATEKGDVPGKGTALRILEKTPDGTWKTKVHILNQEAVPDRP